MAKIITLGEIMLRLSPPNHHRIMTTDTLDATFGGGEANVAVSLAQFGETAVFVSKVPDHALGHAAIQHLRRYGVSTDHILLGGERLGVYFLETGVSLRPSQVIYDRQKSAISEASPDAFDFDAIFKDADWFHFTGITPALSASAHQLVIKACEAAKRHNLTISVDLNYRKKLWTPAQAQQMMKPLMQYVDVCIGNEEDAMHMLGYTHQSTQVDHGSLNIKEYEEMMTSMIKTYDFKVVATTLRTSHSASHNTWQALLHDGNHMIQSPAYDIQPVIDRVGAGDSFSAGLIYGMLHLKTLDEALMFATAASALKHTIHGDQNLATKEEVFAIVKGNTSGRVNR